jgi:uncharacterized membrane protein
MTTFTVWKFDTPDGAGHAASLLKRAEDDRLVQVLDHAVVSWPQGEESPTVTHGHDDTARGAGWGSLWGLLLGAVFAVPVLGLAAGGAIGALSKTTAKLGITKEQMEAIRDEVTEGTSALFLVTDQGNLDRLGERFRGMHMTLVQTNLTEAEREELLETFGSG